MKLALSLSWRWTLGFLAAAAGLGMAGLVGLDTLSGFEGETYVTSKAPERIVVRPPQSAPWWASWGTVLVRYGVETGEIPFADPATGSKLTGGGPNYDVAALPFALQVKRAEVLHETEATNFLAVRGSEGNNEIEFRQGQDVSFAGESWRVQSVRKWTGLLSDPRGESMFSLSLRRPNEAEWTQGITVSSATWRLVEPSIGIHFEWFASEDAARQLTRIEAASPARWGIVEGRSVTWFDSFTPGMGQDLRDGTSITLVQSDSQRVPPAIEVQIAQKGNVRNEWIPVNEHSAKARILYEDFGKLDAVIMASAWREGSVFVTAHYQGQPCGETLLDTGAEWMPSGLPYRVRVEQVLKQAIAADSEHSSISEVILVSGQETLRVREGEAIRRGDNLIEFRRKSNPPQVSYELTASEEGKKSVTLKIAPGERIHFRGCELSQGSPGQDPLHAAVLRASVNAHRVWPRFVLALVFVVAVIAVVWGKPAEKQIVTPPTAGETPPPEEPSSPN